MAAMRRSIVSNQTNGAYAVQAFIQLALVRDVQGPPEVAGAARHDVQKAATRGGTDFDKYGVQPDTTARQESKHSDRHISLARMGGGDGDLDIVTEVRQEFEESSDGETASPVFHQQRDLGLFDAEKGSGLSLGHASFRDNSVDLEGQPRLEKFLSGVGETEVRKDVVASDNDRC